MDTLPICAQLPMVVGNLHQQGIASLTPELRDELFVSVNGFKINDSKKGEIDSFEARQAAALEAVRQSQDPIIISNHLLDFFGNLQHYNYTTNFINRPDGSYDLVKIHGEFAQWILRSVQFFFPDVDSPVDIDVGTLEGIDTYFSSRESQAAWQNAKAGFIFNESRSVDQLGLYLADTFNKKLIALTMASEMNGIDLTEVPHQTTLPKEDVDELFPVIPLICDVARLVGLALLKGDEESMTFVNSFWNRLHSLPVIRWVAVLDTCSKLEQHIPPAAAQ